MRNVSSSHWSLSFGLCSAGLPACVHLESFYLGCNRILYKFLFPLNTIIHCAVIREKKIELHVIVASGQRPSSEPAFIPPSHSSAPRGRRENSRAAAPMEVTLKDRIMLGIGR